MKIKKAKLEEYGTSFYMEKPLSNEDSLITRSNQFCTYYAPHFPVRREPVVISDTRRARDAIKDCIGRDIAKYQYPGHSTTQSFKQLVVRLGPLNKYASHFFNKFKTSYDEENISLGYYDYLEDKHHPGRIAMELLNSYFQTHGNYHEKTEKEFVAVEKMIIEIIRIYPRVHFEPENPNFNYLTGTHESFELVDKIIDSHLKNYPEIIHDQKHESDTLAFHKHLAKNSMLNLQKKISAYHCRESELLKEYIYHYTQWSSNEKDSNPPETCDTDTRIAHCFAAFHAIDRGSRFDWENQIKINMQTKYIERLKHFNLYLKYGKKNGKRIFIRLKRSGDPNKEVSIYPLLVKLSSKIYDPNIETMCRKAIRMRAELKINAELIKFMGNIFGVLTCWEGYEADINFQMISYCENRKKQWKYRADFIQKILRLDFDQMIIFLKEIGLQLSQEFDALQTNLDIKNKLRGTL